MRCNKNINRQKQEGTVTLYTVHLGWGKRRHKEAVESVGDDGRRKGDGSQGFKL